MSLLNVNRDECNLCGLCAVDCPGFVIAMGGEEGFPQQAKGGSERCLKCGHCVAVCPTGALSHELMRADECERIDAGLLPAPASIEHFLKSRRSTRVFRDEPLEQGAIEKLIDIARYAPSGHNSQPVSWIIVSDRERMRSLGGMAAEWMRSFARENPSLDDTMKLGMVADAFFMGMDLILRNAPHLVVAHAPGVLGPLGYEGCIIALTYLELAAYSRGVGACWAGYFEMASVKSEVLQKSLHLPQGHRPYGAMMLGLPQYGYGRIPLRREPDVQWL